MIQKIQDIITESLEVKARVLNDPGLVARVGEIVTLIVRRFREGKHLYFCGNGGSAADAQHLAAELVVRLRVERPGLPALALTTNTSILTAAGNDYGFERIFSRQVESLVGPHDVVVALSTSGTSPNILKAIETGRSRGAFLVALTGEAGGALAGKVNILIDVPSRDPQRIQEAHITIGHIVCSLIEHLVAAN